MRFSRANLKQIGNFTDVKNLTNPTSGQVGPLDAIKTLYMHHTTMYIWYYMRILTIVKCFRRLLQQVGPVGVGDSLIEERTSLVQSTSFTMIFYYNKLTSFTMIFFYNKSITSSIIFFILLPSSGAVSPFYNNRSPNQPTIQVYKRPNE